jgi:hypothetical protein
MQLADRLSMASGGWIEVIVIKDLSGAWLSVKCNTKRCFDGQGPEKAQKYL